MSLATKLSLGIALLVTVSVGSVSLLAFTVSRRSLREQVLSANLTAATLAARAVEQYIADAANIMREAPGQSKLGQEVRRENWPEASKLLEDFLRNFTQFDSVFVRDPQGIIRARVPHAEAVGEDFSFWDFFREAMRTGRLHISGVHVSKADRRSVVSISVPVLDGDNIKGVLVGALSLGRISQLISMIGREDRSVVYVVDGEGLLIAHSGGARAGLPEDMKARPIVQAVMAGKSGTMEFREPDRGESLLGAYVLIPRLGWGVVATKPIWVVYAAANRLGRWLLWMALGCTAAAVLFGWGLARTWTGPLLRFSEPAAGDPVIRVTAESRDEQAVLAPSFNPMAEHLQESYRDLEREITESKQTEEPIWHDLERVKALHEIDLAITSTLDLRTVLDVLLGKIDSLLPYPVSTTVRLRNRDTGELEPISCLNLNEAVWKQPEWKSGRGLTNVVAETRIPLVAENIYTDPRVRDREFFRRYNLVSYLGLPLMAKRELLGVLSIYRKEEHRFTHEEVEFLSTIAGQAAIAIQNSQLYEETKKQAVELEKSNKVKSEFLSVMSHELRTPLNVVIGYAGMIKDGMFGEINPEQEEGLGKVLKQANDQLTTINSILYATQLEARAIIVDRYPVMLTDFLNNLRSDYDAPLDKELTLNWDYPSELPPVITDSEKLKHILKNLIDNAIKFTERGNVTLSAQYLPQANSVEFKVTDTAIGIPKESLSVIFEKFHQVDSSETRSYGGVGLGLYIVKQLTELLGGHVGVESELGKGSTFAVTIPYEKPVSQDISEKN